MIPFISVVIPTYNRADLLRVCLEALVTQTLNFEEFEVIVVNDGSQNPTKTYLDSCKATFPFTFRAIHLTNGGPARARNAGVHAARGKVIVFLDDDIEPLPECLETHYDRHKESDTVVVVGPQSRDISRHNQEPLWIRWEHNMLDRQYQLFSNGTWASAGPNNFYTGNASLRRDLILSVGGFNETFSRQEDVEFAFRLIKIAKVKFVIEPRACAIHRPVRQYTTWLTTPNTYGAMDVIRIESGHLSNRILREAYHHRNALTRIVLRCVIGRPTLVQYVCSVLMRVGIFCDATLGDIGERVGMSMLSVVYNVQYLDGASGQLGDAKQLWSTIYSKD